MIEMYTETQKNAIMRHTCDLCRRPILPGAEYICVKYRDNGWHYRKYHIHCNALLDAVAHNLPDSPYFEADELTEILRHTCTALHDMGECADEDYEALCTDMDCYSCYLVQRFLIPEPAILRAAEQSVKDNTRI